jgi:predicted ATPase
MLTRLKVSGFKNLVDVDVRFGPFTCVVGPNGIGKSNLFDAIRFLSMLAAQSLIDAALSVRDEGRRTGHIHGLFHRSGGLLVDQMSFEAEMIVPPNGVDDLGQSAEASITFLCYGLTLAYRKDSLGRSPGALEILKEELTQINLGDAREHLRVTHTPLWRRSTIRGRRTSAFISTEDHGQGRTIKLHQDGSAGRPRQFLAATLPRTTLSAVNATENPTALLARRELQSWRLLQLEPSALRRPDPFTAPTQRGVDGSHLAATLYRLAQENNQSALTPADQQSGIEQVYGQVANRLAELIDDVQRVWIERDERRELLTLYVASRNQTPHPALALSDGTLRFLALATLDLDPHVQGVLCLEEPENGIHPSRIPAMLHLLRDIVACPNHHKLWPTA